MTGTTPIDTIIQGDCLEEMKKLPDRSIDAIVTDPPAGINFMQKSWDGDKGGRNQWIAWMKDIAGECLRVIKPGGHALVWALPRTSHWTGMAWEGAGWEPRDKISHVFGSGFPKSLDISKAIDKRARRDYVIAAVELGFMPPGRSYDDWTKESHSPSDKWWEEFKKHLSPEQWQEIEREVIGKGTSGQTAIWQDGGMGDFDITAPATPAAKQWAGFGTSLKPAYENWWLFQKPLNTNTALYSNIAKIKTLEVELCQLRSSVKIAEKSSTSNLRDLGVELNSAQWTVEEKNNTQDALSAQTDMSRLESGMTSSLNTVLSWKSILEDLLAATKTSTIGTAIDQIIDWRTLNCCLSEITPAYIILVKLNLLGQNSRVSTVVESLNAELWNLSGILALSARVRATYKESNLLRNENGVLQSDWWLFRAPLDGCTIAENVLRWGCGGLNVDGCRINPGEIVPGGGRSYGACDGVHEGWKRPAHADYESKPSHDLGRFPSNLIHDNSPAVLAEFAKAGERTTGDRSGHRNQPKTKNSYGVFALRNEAPSKGDTGSASRFFMACEFTPADYAPMVYYAKASRSEREAGLDGMPARPPSVAIPGDPTNKGQTGNPYTTTSPTPKTNFHPTVKPLALMQYLCKLITPPGGTILDPFGGSGTTGMAAIKEGFHYILIEKEPEYCEIARKRIAAVPARLDRWAEAVI